MEPGRKMDALAAEKIIGWVNCGVEYTEMRGSPPKWAKLGHTDRSLPVPHYSTDIAAAWQVVEAIEHHGWFVEIGWCNAEYGPKKRAWCQIGEYGNDGAYAGEAYEDTAPHAICLAALRALGVDLD